MKLSVQAVAVAVTVAGTDVAVEVVTEVPVAAEVDVAAAVPVAALVDVALGVLAVGVAQVGSVYETSRLVVRAGPVPLQKNCV